MNVSQPVSSAISGVDFTFLSSADIGALSVKRITNPTTFDTLLHPVPGGLYDAALGAFLDNPCTTCNLKHINCPGHCGHIELPVPVYHPTFMDQTLRLLRAKCVYCHRLKMSRVEVNRYCCKLRLVRAGLLKEAQDLDEVGLSRAHKEAAVAAEESSEDDEDDENEIVTARNKFVKRVLKAAGGSRTKVSWSIEKNEAVGEERRTIIKEFLAEITQGKKCGSCKGVSRGYRKDRYVKIFKKPLNPKDHASMVQSGFTEPNPLVLRNRRIQKKKQQEKSKQLPNGHLEDEGFHEPDSSNTEEGVGDDVDMDDSDEDLVMETESATQAPKEKNGTKEKADEYMSAGEVHAALSFLFEQEEEVLRLVYSPRSRTKGRTPINADMFFIHQLLVPPNRFRPEAKTGGDEITESSDNGLYKNILTCCETINQINIEIRGKQPENGRRQRGFSDLQVAWVSLQDAVNSLMDRDRNPIQGAAGKRNDDGIKQKLEKKEGLFRKNMMGKRVNFAARSVISPDPNIETNEIGVPPVFAKKLTYPEPVTNHNFYELKEAVINGPERWPGAAAIENENGQVINLKLKNQEERIALANQLLAPSNTSVNGSRNKKVHRHLNNGDIVIMNRQPTLHKPSMMCHRARVLPGEKTIRMHYANCNTYNADFDGDEMNMHFPQNEIARSEAINIADTDHQYLSATAGKPLRGLIQDHISMGVQLCNRDVFFTREEYQQLLYACLRPESNHTTTGSLVTIAPAIFRPRKLWTGKQVITTVLKNITPRSHVGLNLKSKSQTSAEFWGKGSEEQDVLFLDGELLCGILDKKQIGPASGGFVNAVYEAYGHTIAGRLLSVLGRLLTKVLHMRAFSCGVEDLILNGDGEKSRRDLLRGVDKMGFEVAAKYVSLDGKSHSPDDPELRRRLESVLRDEKQQESLDAVMKNKGSELSSNITKSCLPETLVKPFPKNQMQAMTGTGAKGSQVNANQISCNLGQQVLEGRRVPVMVSGKTLPCFKPFEPSIRGGGYIADRFLTGLRPQEYFFHAMSGREGLIDTAVKTSRSGYLQRCLIKGMEGLKVEYDTTVRDSDGTLIQFLYGEDGLDVTKAKTDFKFLAENFFSLFPSLGIRDEYSKIQSEAATEWNKKALKKVKRSKDIVAMDTALSVFAPARHAGSTSEKFYRAQKEYVDDNPDNLIADKKKAASAVMAARNYQAFSLKKKNFQALLDVKYLKSIVEAGEAVGVVAGQSVGEPSTQMTLNTFHLAGHATKNVTLGIPRLREIVMTASAKIPTPTMKIHLNPEITDAEGERFAKGISRLSLAEIMDKVTVNERLCKGVGYAQAKVYTIRLDFFPAKEYCEEYAITVLDVLRTLEHKFIPRLQKATRAELKKKGDEKSLKKSSDAMPTVGQSAGRVEEEQARPEGGREGGDDDSSDDEGDDEGDATNTKSKANQKQNVSYDAPDDEEEVIAAQGRRDATTEAEDDDEVPESPATTPTNEAADSNDESSDDETEAAITKIKKQTNDAREARIKEKSNDISSFSFDYRSGSWCEFSLEYAAETAKLLMLNLVELACRESVIQAIPGLGNCVYGTDAADPSGKTKIIDTEGINLTAMREFQDVIDPHSIETNDIAAMLQLYGVEACRANIVRELMAVFSGHAIDVDYRHLYLIGDVMTRGGGFTPFNRNGLKTSASPFMKMSFETTVGFLRDAVLEEDWDELRNPSARIVVGKLGGMGTGAFDLLMPVGVSATA